MNFNDLRRRAADGDLSEDEALSLVEIAEASQNVLRSQRDRADVRARATAWISLDRALTSLETK